MMLSGKAALAGVIGWPVGHSKSPRLHNFWLNRYGIDGAYVPLAVRPEDLEKVLRILPRMGFKGVNLTIPHKEAALGIADRLDSWAKSIGAVNTIVFDEDGTIEGRNTDSFGFFENLHRRLPSFDAAQGPTVVLGAGGAARAVIAALVDVGSPEIRLVNRTLERGRTLAAAFSRTGGTRFSPLPWEQRNAALEGASLLVNTTSLGMVGQPPLSIDLRALPLRSAVADIVYVPLVTDLLACASARGHPTVDGLGMLLHQACPGFSAWFKTVPEVDDEVREMMEAP